MNIESNKHPLHLPEEFIVYSDRMQLLIDQINATVQEVIDQKREEHISFEMFSNLCAQYSGMRDTLNYAGLTGLTAITDGVLGIPESYLDVSQLPNFISEGHLFNGSDNTLPPWLFEMFKADFPFPEIRIEESSYPSTDLINYPPQNFSLDDITFNSSHIIQNNQLDILFSATVRALKLHRQVTAKLNLKNSSVNASRMNIVTSYYHGIRHTMSLLGFEDEVRRLEEWPNL